MSSQSYIYNPTERTLAAAGDGFSCPRLTTTGRTALALTAGDKGMMVYDTTLTTLCIWTGAAWEFINDNSNAIVSVKDFGAKGDGVTDDTAAIQNALDLNDNIYFPTGVYLISSPIRATRAVTIEGEQNAVVKASASFTGIAVTKSGVPFTLKAAFAIFTGNIIDTIVGSRIGENGIGVKIGNITINCNNTCDYGMWIERCPGVYVGADVTDCAYGIYLGPYCWGAVLNKNRIFRFSNTGIRISEAANGASITDAEIWGETVLGLIGIDCYGNNNGLTISGGYVEYCQTGVYLSLDTGSVNIFGVDFEAISLYCIRGNKTTAETRSLGPINVTGCYLDSTDSEIYNKGYRFIVTGCRFRDPSAAGYHYYSVDNESLFMLFGNSYDTTGGTPIPESLTGTTYVTSEYITNSILQITNKKRTEPSGAYATGWGLFNYTSVNQPEILSSSMVFQNSRQGGADLLYSGRWSVVANETNTNPSPAVYSSAGVNLQSLGGNRSFTPLSDNTHKLGNASFRWSEVFAGNGTINTSDANEKQQVRDLTDIEKSVAAQIKKHIKAFKWNDAVHLKGDKARIHVGVIAQEVQKAFVDHNLDPDEYGMICRDTWYEYNGREVLVDENKMCTVSRYEYNGVIVDEQPMDEFGKPVNGLLVIESKHPTIEKTRLGVRYDQLICFVISVM